MPNSINGQLQTTELLELAKELKDVQKQFDMYHTEMGVNSMHLHDETLTTQHEAHQQLHQGSEQLDNI